MIGSKSEMRPLSVTCVCSTSSAAGLMLRSAKTGFGSTSTVVACADEVLSPSLSWALTVTS